GSSTNFDERRWGGSLSIGKRYTNFTSITTTLEYLNLNVSDNKAGRTLSPNGTDNFFSLSSSYRYDTRDLADYPRIGTLIGISISKVGLFDGIVNYQRVGVDYRRYIPMYNDVVLAARVFANLASGGRIPNYGHVFFGYGDRIRGYFNKILEGEQIVGSTVEFHIPIIEPSYIRIEEIPIEQFKDFRYALYFAVFADAGTTWYRDEPLALNRFFSGYGVGLHLNLAYSVVARVEFAIPYAYSFSRGEIIFDLGAAL
ncbi:MAG: BamA/TamA family outer membrane protein, partial [Bacteroidota bacterium]|nr:BamA/TamA family outer membrane protein [Bacteroidota bacterium]